ncbi:MAG: hypothetical protein ACTSQJ_19525, partial [Promethearchaeota archaeon]
VLVLSIYFIKRIYGIDGGYYVDGYRYSRNSKLFFQQPFLIATFFSQGIQILYRTNSSSDVGINAELRFVFITMTTMKNDTITKPFGISKFVYLFMQKL